MNGDDCETMSVPAAGRKYFNLGRDGSYRAAKRGDIPTMNLGRLKRVPVRAMERRIDAVGRASNDATKVGDHANPLAPVNLEHSPLNRDGADLRATAAEPHQIDRANA
jgi:hypothetical protein